MDENNKKAIRLAKEGQKNRALICIRHKKMLMKDIDKMDGQEISLNQVITGIESAKADINIMQALKDGDQLLKDLRAQASLEDFEKLVDDHQENLAMQDREIEMYG